MDVMMMVAASTITEDPNSRNRVMQPRDMNDSAEDLVDPIQHSAHLSTAPSLRVETAALNLSSALVGARKRKALRVVKHQSPSKSESETAEERMGVCDLNVTNGNTSMDTGVSSDLSESRPSLGSELSDGGSESGVEFYGQAKPKEQRQERHPAEHSDSDSDRSDSRRKNQSRKRSVDEDMDEDDDDELDDEDDDEEDSADGATPAKRAMLDQHKCPQCGDDFTSRADLIRHVQSEHASALDAFASQANLWARCAAGRKDLADIPSILHLAQGSSAHPLLAAAAAAAAAGAAVNGSHDDLKGDLVSDEYKNEEDDPFSAVLREMKLKGEFPCRLCDAVYPNLRALKGHNRNHLTQAPYRCNMCPKTSNDKGALIRHMRTHNGERPYECRECQYAFTTKANCERHLRNRHGKTHRDEVRACIIYHLSEDSSVNNKSGGEESAPLAPLPGKSTSGSSKPTAPFFSKTMVDLTRNLLLDLTGDGERNDASHGDDNDDASTDYPSEDENEQDGPLDLTVDVLDLRKRRAEETNNAAAAAVAAAAAAASAADNKPVFVPPYFGSAYGGASLAGLPFFYPGLGGASYSAFLESKLAEMGNPAMDLSALALAAELHHDAIRQVQGVQTKINPALPAGLLMPAKNFAAEESRMASAPIKAELKKASGSSAPVTAPSSAASVASAHLTSEPVKMVLKNGVLVKKQKQRRYRTERPFGCDHCTARFTLRSNMERHIKQQHPDVWSTRPRGHRRSACSLTPKSGNSSALPTMVDPAKLADSKAPISDQVRMAIAQQLKLKRSGEKRQSDENGQSDDEDGALVIDEAKEMVASGATVAAATPAAPATEGAEAVKSRETADLASVSKLLNNVAQNFQHYFQSHPEEVKASASEAGTDDADDAESNESGSDGPSGSDYGGTRSDGGQVTKKKSAYSNAPHRVSCPYCSRKFPWTSSLRRHILTHTGQKPYKCPQCPLWFTTKSNCDRHLLRKHGNNNDSNNSRNVPDRPYKCALCPSSTFATSDNLKKHVDNKHCPGHSSAESHDAASDEDTKPRAESPCPAEGAEASAGSAASGELPFKCHLCDEGYAERPEVLNHLQQQHADEFQALISKGALDSGATAQGHTSDEGEDADSARGKFPDYLNRKVMCAFCMRRFWSAEDLRRHMRTHSGERPFECEQCGRRFTLKHSMLRHKRKHDAAKSGEEVDESEDEDDDNESTASDADQPPPPESAKVRMQALWQSGAQAKQKAKLLKMGASASDLIGNLLGIQDTSLVEQLMSKPADDAARLLGVTGNRV